MRSSSGEDGLLAGPDGSLPGSALGLVVPSLANPFWGALARELEQVSARDGYQLRVCNSERDRGREFRYVEQLLNEGVRGLVTCSSSRDMSHLVPLIERGARVVAVDRSAKPGDPACVANVCVDNAAGIRLAVDHLRSLGHRRICYVSAPIPSVSRDERSSAFAAAVAESGLEEDECAVWPPRAHVPFGDTALAELGRTAACELLTGEEDQATAFICVNDMCALGFSSGALDLGYRIPDDISVVGFDDVLLAAFFHPPLTTVRQPLAVMAEAAFAAVRGMVEGGDRPTGSTVVVQPELVVRGSAGPVRTRCTRG
ncbi:substrate-binding domain-containing protein [Lentzea sp. HUAS12]|uniref:substrate-binding domain-containing protein n=1 Tax=Lentzea sp. HUAS12 TaxID=2951806 RepID=UPI00209EE7E2|nr:substrate-binding domain-containing protein [Lentzea sp. HUAS12]USX54033.1 substrate-binding domain-containing protein [Lentzea sp. HUAS12]